MKSFDEFRNSLSEDDICEIVSVAQDSLENSREDFSKDPRTSLGNQIATISYSISIGLLEKYHEWLEK
ncbi:hypothetical protein QuyetLC_22760 [Bacillus anthracis]|uniref:Uncharacterized protein n=1 Tax=Bacillus anthracis TaxID=1392 RepID=A0A640NQM6_BACAN|nr:hypothetical protein [Enterococcus faecalis]MEB7968794.1 hypothetical protein [Enterococcus faecalis]GEU27909.1 hypothetical protein QuyetLC_22760 [Bacillus anthracis]